MIPIGYMGLNSGPYHMGNVSFNSHSLLFQLNHILISIWSILYGRLFYSQWVGIAVPKSHKTSGYQLNRGWHAMASLSTDLYFPTVD